MLRFHHQLCTSGFLYDDDPGITGEKEIVSRSNVVEAIEGELV